VYTLFYDLYTSALNEKRESNGQIKLRLRIEFIDARKVTLASMDLPPQLYVNVATAKDYETARFTCEGKVSSAASVTLPVLGIHPYVFYLCSTINMFSIWILWLNTPKRSKITRL
jgi:hypothetical protein